jgi:heterodisulfide reductase subunit C
MSESDVSNALQNAGLDVLTCIQCGTCSGSCPSGRYTGLNTRRIVRGLCAGRDILHDKDLWMCTTCYTCQERCPRDIRIADTIMTVRTIAVHKGIMLPAHRKVSQLVLKYGHAVPINDEVIYKRKKLKMEPLPSTVHRYPDALADVQTLLESCEFDRLIA